MISPLTNICNGNQYMAKTTLPHGENLRNAVRWLDEQINLQKNFTTQESRREAVEKAGLLFDLTPLEEDFLIRKFVTEKDA